MIVIQGYVRVPAGKVAALREAAEPMIAATRAEPGCIAYTYAEDLLEPGLVHFIERWSDQAALDGHNASAHLRDFSVALAGFGVEALRVAAYDAPAERVLLGV